MPRVAKISISLTPEALAAADRERRRSGETRSQLFRRALVCLIDQHRERRAVERYVAGHVAEPEPELYGSQLEDRSTGELRGDQITLPRAIRDRLGVRTGDRVDFRLNDRGEVILEAATLDLNALAGSLDAGGRRLSLEQIDEVIQRAATQE